MRGPSPLWQVRVSGSCAPDSPLPARPPDQGLGGDPVAGRRRAGRAAEAAGALRSGLDLLHQTRLREHCQQLGDDQLEAVLVQAGEGSVRAPQVLAVLAARRQEQAGPVGARPGRVRVRRADLRLVTGRQHPRVRQPLLGGPLQGLEGVVAEVGHVDRQRAAHLVKERLDDLCAQRRVGVPQRGVRGVPAVLLAGHPVQVLVVDLQQARLLQVRHGDAPAALQIQVEPEGDHVAQRAGRIAGQAGGEVGVTRVVAGCECEGVGDGRGQLLVVQAVLAGVQRRPVQRPAQLGDLHEVVEVARLEGGVLPVVDEGEELARLLVQSLLRHRLQRPHDGRRDERGRRRTALLVQRGQLGEVTAARLLVRHPAVQAEEEGGRNEGGLQLALALLTVRVDGDRAGYPVAVGALDDLLAPVVHLQPRLRQPAVVDRVLHVRRPLPLVVDVQVAVALPAAGRRGFAAGLVADLAVILGAPHRQVLLAALPAERQRHQQLAAAARLFQLVGAGEVAGELVLQGDVDGVTLGEELMQPESEQGALGERVAGL